jgi:hypothetical protein
MSWNYRVVRRKEVGEDVYGIHEAFYDGNNPPHTITMNPVSFEDDTLDDLKSSLRLARLAFNMPTLEHDDFKRDSGSHPEGENAEGG